MLGRFLQETQSAHPCAVQTRIRPVHFSIFFMELLVFYCARPLLLSARALRPRNSHKTLSAYACAVETRFRPSNLGVFFVCFR